LLRALPDSHKFGTNRQTVLPLQRQKTKSKGTESFPSLFRMTNESQTKTLEQMVGGLISQDGDLFLVDISIRPTNNIKVFLDGDKGISIEKCVAINRQLYRQIEESSLFPADDFSLEVSSPGLDEPLKLFRQYKKNLGRKVEVIGKDGVRLDGLLKEVTEDGILVEEQKGKGKKQETIPHTILFESIKTTKIQIVF